MSEWAEACGVTVVWLSTLDRRTRGYYRPESRELFLSKLYWRGRPADEMVRFVAHEVGHELTGTAYYTGEEPTGANYHAIEGKATTAGLAEYIKDADIQAALNDGCVELWEFAERWQVPAEDAARRLRGYQG